MLESSGAASHVIEEPLNAQEQIHSSESSGSDGG